MGRPTLKTMPGVAINPLLGSHLKASEAVAEIPKRQRHLHRPSLIKLLGEAHSRQARNWTMASAYLEHGYTLLEIGRAAGLHYATVSRIVKAQEKTRQGNM